MAVIAIAVKAALIAGLAAAPPVKVTVTAPGHTPKVNTRWHYVVRATQGGKPVPGRITEQIVDPIGGVHPVEFGKGTKPIKNWPFKGVFRDYMIWPASSRGIPLKFRIIVVTGKTTKVVTYAVTPTG
jgi:hypothetical protein